MKKYIGGLTILILWLISIYSLYSVLYFHKFFNIQNYIAFLLLVLLTIMWLIKINKLNIFIILILLIGTFDIISFSVNSLTIDFNFIVFGIHINFIKIQILSFVLLLIFVIIDFKSLRELAWIISPGEIIEDSSGSKKIIETFKLRFEDYSISKLKTITEDNGYVKEAKIAAQEILNTKQKQDENDELSKLSP